LDVHQEASPARVVANNNVIRIRFPSDRQLESNILSMKENRITLSSNRSLSQDDQEEQEDKVLRPALAHLIMVGEIVVGNGDIS
jgi:ribosomal 50S subunit-recycling heat shock protein